MLHEVVFVDFITSRNSQEGHLVFGPREQERDFNWELILTLRSLASAIVEMMVIVLHSVMEDNCEGGLANNIGFHTRSAANRKLLKYYYWQIESAPRGVHTPTIVHTFIPGRSTYW